MTGGSYLQFLVSLTADGIDSLDLIWAGFQREIILSFRGFEVIGSIAAAIV